MTERATSVGVISDTHGLLRPEALAALEGSELIIHCGDIGAPEVVPRLRQIARVVAIRGNVDHGPWAAEFAATEVVECAGALIYVLHDVLELDLAPAAAGFQAVLAGHSHQPKIEERNGVLYVNPGSAGPRRFKLPVTVARLEIRAGDVRASIVPLAVAGPSKER